MGFWDEPLYDLNHDGIETPEETYIGMQLFASSRQEAIDLTGDDTFYPGTDKLSSYDDDEDYEGSGYSLDELEDMDADEMADLGFDPDDF